MEVLIHVPGDRESVIEYLKKNNIEYKVIQKSIWVKNTLIFLDEYGDYGNRLGLLSDIARDYGGKPVRDRFGWGDIYLPFEEQVKIFNRLKRAITNQRKNKYRPIEEQMQGLSGLRNFQLEQIQKMIDFEKNVLREEHRLEEQIARTMIFILQLKVDMPKATFTSRGHNNVDYGVFAYHVGKLNEILVYLREEEIEAVHITQDLNHPVQIEKEGQKIKAQKKHLRALSSQLNAFVRVLREFLRHVLRNFQITKTMRDEIRRFYEVILNVYKWYANFFKNAASKKVT